MRWHARLFVLGFVPLVSLLIGFVGFIPLATAQYLFLDTNGNGIRDAGDAIDASGTTTIDIWLETNRNRDGSAASCGDPRVGLTINCYTLALEVEGGTVRFGPMQNRLPFTGDRPVCWGAMRTRPTRPPITTAGAGATSSRPESTSSPR